MQVSAMYPTFNASLTTGNPQPQTVETTGASTSWKITNIFNTSWLKVSPLEGFRDAIFSVSVNIYDLSVVLGNQTGILLVENQDTTITMQVSLNVTR